MMGQACWSATGMQIYAGRRNGAIDVWDVRQLGRSSATGEPRLLKTIRNPASSGLVSCVAAFPDGKHIAWSVFECEPYMIRQTLTGTRCSRSASNDNIRLWNVAEAGVSTKSGVQFKIIPGHHGGFVSQMRASFFFI
jgi:transcriptional activator SPT8